MTATTKPPKTVGDYIAGQPPKIQTVLRRIRRIVRSVAPDAVESISYRVPTYKANGHLLYVGAFQDHIGIYPPVRGNAALERAVAAYANEKGNLRFPLDKPIPYPLIERIVRSKFSRSAKRPSPARKR